MAKRNREHEQETAGGYTEMILENGAEAMAENGVDNDHMNVGSAPEPDDEQKKGKPHEQKLADFSRIMSNRASNVMDTMVLIGKLANPAVYAWTEDQENKVFGTLEAKIVELRETFARARAVAEAPNQEKGKRVRVHSIGV